NILSNLSGTLSVDRARRFQHEQPRRTDFGTTFSNPLLHVLFARQQHARRQLAPRRIAAHQIERTLADTDPTHTMMNSSWSKSLLRDRKPLAFRAQQVTLRHAAVFVSDFSVTGVIAALVAHHVDISHDLKSRRR